ncbi:hypothetical protein KJ780_02030 [Candidatus Micrarchaeota archaeon]|nr:hypothetical protein [Candidatus Micrarchaeota archaeon]
MNLIFYRQPKTPKEIISGMRKIALRSKPVELTIGKVGRIHLTETSRNMEVLTRKFFLTQDPQKSFVLRKSLEKPLDFKDELNAFCDSFHSERTNFKDETKAISNSTFFMKAGTYLSLIISASLAALSLQTANFLSTTLAPHKNQFVLVPYIISSVVFGLTSVFLFLFSEPTHSDLIEIHKAEKKVEEFIELGRQLLDRFN